MDRPKREHLRRLDTVWTRRPVYFVTVCALRRQAVLAQEPIARAAVEALSVAAQAHGWRVGRYVVMPDHIHFFCTPATECDLSRFVGGFRQESTRRAWEAGWQGKLWQREFFDRLLRGDESYERKWLYVRDNPVRAGLCQRPDEWRWQGELGVL